MGGWTTDRRIGAAARKRFVAGIEAGLRLEEAAAEAGYSLSGFYGQRRRDPRFDRQCRDALQRTAREERVRVRPNNRRQLQRRRMRHVRFDERRQEIFLNHFSGCADARESAEVAGVDHSTVYKHRRKDPVFAAEFDGALDQAYVQLRVEAVRQRLAAQQRLRDAVEQGPVTGEVADEFERVIKLLDRWDRRDGRIAIRSSAPEKRRALSFDEALDLLDRKLAHLDIPILALPAEIAERYDGPEAERTGGEAGPGEESEGGQGCDGEGI